MSRDSFIGIRELDREILFNLDDDSLDQACLTNWWTQKICQDPLFWREKTLRTYGLSVLQHKPLGETFHHQYQRLRRLQYNPDQYYSAIRNGRLDEMIVLKDEDIKPPRDAMNYAARRGTRQILDLLFAQGLRPTANTYYDAIWGKSLENFKWIQQRGIPLNRQLANSAATAGAPEILEYLFQNYNLLPQIDQSVLNSLATRGDLETLIWLDQHNLGLPDQATANLVRTIIDYIVNEGPLTSEERRLINANVGPQPFTESIRARINRLTPGDISWDYLKRHLTREEIDQVRRRYQDVLDWLISKRVHPQ